MTYRTFIKNWGAPVLMPVLLTLFMIGISSGADYLLRAEVKVIPPGTFGNRSSVTMWGYANCTATGFANCTTAATVPGPTLTAAVGETLNITVFNNISGSYKEPTSIVIPRQTKAIAPVWIDPADPLGPPVATGPTGRGTNYTARVRSFDTETAFGQTQTYTWTSLRGGTYLYESGTHPAVQVQMGLYGALIVGGAATDVTLLFSEIDPALHSAISNGLYGPTPPDPRPEGWMTSPVEYRPKYFLVNGSPYSASSPAANAGSPGTVRLRMLNAGQEVKIPTLQDKFNLLADQHMTVVAEDGYALPHPKLQYSQLLPPGKTMDATITTSGVGNVVLYDRKLNLTNGPFSPGGALINLNIGTVPAITALPNVLNFGDVPLLQPTQMVVTIKNDGLANLIVLSTSGISGPSSAEFRTVFGITTIPPGTSSTVTVLLRATTAGPKSAALTLNSDDPNLGTVTIPIFANAF
jgi:hypothetical protein